MNLTSSTQLGNKGVTKFKTFNFERRSSTRYSMPICHFDGFNMWLLKPTHLNRGRGIHVFRDLDTLHKLIREYCQGKDEEVKVAPPKKKGGEGAEEGSPEAACGTQEAPTGEMEGGEEGVMPVAKRQSPSKKKAVNPAYKIKHNTFII